jgi:Protoglobin
MKKCFVKKMMFYRMLKYLDWVAKIHTDTPTKKSKISVDYIHVNALLGYVESTLVGGLLSLNLDRETESAALLAFNKLLWIQNDFFAKYYCKDGVEEESVSSTRSFLNSTCQNTSMITLVVAAAAAWTGFMYAKHT